MNKLYFRAWHKGFKRMVEVLTVNIKGGYVACYDKALNILNIEDDEMQGYVEYDFDEVILMQGIEIEHKNIVLYEGDIIRIRDKFIDDAIVGFGCYKWYLSDTYEPRYGKDYEIEDLQWYNFEIIGNIYENKELIGDD